MCWLKSLIYVVLCVGLTACGGGGGSGTNTANQNPASGLTPVDVNISGGVIMEGNTGPVLAEFAVSLSSASASDVIVDYATSSGSAVAADDFTAIQGSLVIPAGSTQANIGVELVSDTCFEEDESFSLVLSNVSSNAQLTSSIAVATISNDDARPLLDINDASIVEGDTGSSDIEFSITLDRMSCTDVSVDYASSHVTTSATDFSVTNDTLLIPAGVTQVTLPVAIVGDTDFEPDDTLLMSLSNVSDNATLGDSEAFGTVYNDDLPVLSMGSPSVTEGNLGNKTLVFPVTLEGPAGSVTFDYTTQDGSALLSDNDYVANSGSLVINAGDTSAVVAVEIVGDETVEPDETVNVQLSNVSGAVLLVDTMAGTIIDDDDSVTPSGPVVTVVSASVLEADSSPVNLVFNVQLSEVVGSAVTFDYVTSDNDAQAGIDYTAANGSVTVPAGDLIASIVVEVLGDTEDEADETFNLTLSNISANASLDGLLATGRIIDNEGMAANPRMYVSDAMIEEGDSGQRNLQFLISLSEPAGSPLTVDYATQDVSALAGIDYTSVSGTLDFSIGDTQLNVSVPVMGETRVEADETFELLLSNVTGSVILGDDVGTGSILTDDPFAQIRINDAGAEEGDTGTHTLLFDVTLSVVADDEVTVDYVTSDGTATVGDADYVDVIGSLVIPAGQTQGTIQVVINGDADNEIDEQFSLALSNPSANAQLIDTLATGSIVNDDSGNGWGIPQRLDPTEVSSEGMRPRVDMNSSGEAMVAWINHDFSLGGSFSSRFSPAGGWSSVEQITADSAKDYDLSIDEMGNSILLWIMGEVLVSHNQPTIGPQWNAEIELEPRQQDQDFMRLANNNDGVTLAMWQMDSFDVSSNIVHNMMYSFYDPVAGSWSTTDFLVNDGSVFDEPAIAMDPDGPGIDAVAVWLDGALKLSRYDDVLEQWSTPMELGDEIFPGSGLYPAGYHPQVAMDAAGNVMVVWHDNRFTGLGAGDVWLRRYDVDTDTWESPLVLDLSANDATRPQVVMDDSGNATVIWLEDGASGNAGYLHDIVGRRYDATTGNWTPALTDPPQLIADANLVVRSVDNGFLLFDIDNPSLSIDGQGNIMMIWSQDVNGTGDHVIRASRYEVISNSWTPPEPISDDTVGDAFSPHVDVDANGNAIAVWAQLDPLTSLYQVWSNRFTSP